MGYSASNLVCTFGINNKYNQEPAIDDNFIFSPTEAIANITNSSKWIG